MKTTWLLSQNIENDSAVLYNNIYIFHIPAELKHVSFQGLVFFSVISVDGTNMAKF